jgi:hypothetical protein
VYNFAVTRELLKQVYIKEGLQPPSLLAFREAYASVWSQVTNPRFVGSLIKSGEIGKVGIYGLQAYGIFKVRCLFFFCAFGFKTNKFFLFLRLAKYLVVVALLGTKLIRTLFFLFFFNRVM